MQTVRVIAIGLLIAAGLMVALAKTFFTYWLTASGFHLWADMLNASSAGGLASTGLGLVGPAVFVTLCMGAGLLLSATVYANLEDWIFVTEGG